MKVWGLGFKPAGRQGVKLLILILILYHYTLTTNPGSLQIDLLWHELPCVATVADNVANQG